MSLLRWFTRDRARNADAPDSSTTVYRVETTRPAEAALGRAELTPAQRKGERILRRERLYGVIRECLLDAGHLTSSYRFKVLSLDNRGRRCIVMVDLAAPQDSGTRQLATIEAAIAHAARARHGISVKAVYWRRDERAGAPAARAAP